MVGNCKIKILTQFAESKSEYTATGTFERQYGGFSVSYLQGTDKVRLVAKNNALIMTRCGETAIRMFFRRGSRTRARLGANGAEGNFIIDTKVYELSTNTDGYRVFLKYDLQFSYGSENYCLELFVIKNSEEK